MNSKQNNNFKRLFMLPLMLMAIGSMIFYSACKKTEVVKPTQTILQIIQGDTSYSELAKYLDLFPDLKAIASGTADYTVFVPDNAAFASLYATPGFPPNPADISPDLIKGVVAYHFVAGKLMKSALTPTGTGAGLTTLYNDTNACTGAETNQAIKINDDGTLLTGSTNNAIEITIPDKEATNGVVQVVGRVLIPPSIGAGLTPILGTLAATVLLGADFRDLAKVVTIADCGVTGVTPLISILANPAGAYTVFLPPDAVFEGTATAMSITVDQLIASFTAEQWRGIILNHMVGGVNNLTDLTDGSILTTMLTADTKLTVIDVPVSANTPVGKIMNTSGGATGMGGTVQCPILVADIPASNGVAHVVGKILFPN